MTARPTPTETSLKANTLELREWIAQHRGIHLDDYEALRQWSVRDASAFWRALWDHFDIQSPNPPGPTLGETRMPLATWFPGTEVNYARQVLRHASSNSGATAPAALLFRNERMQREGQTAALSWADLADQSAAMAATLQRLGVQRGDRVAAYLPNVPEAIVGLLACASLGAIWSLCAPDMGLSTVRDRFRQITPKVLIACDGSVYGGKVADRRELVRSLLQELPSLAALVWVPCLEPSGVAPVELDVDEWTGQVTTWQKALAQPERVAPQDVPFDHPLWIVYSSGTTGLPKPIVHGHGGVMLEMLKLHRFHLNLGPTAQTGDRLHWYSSSGWVMWNLQASALLLGTTVCVYDGHPSFPAADTLWRFAGDVGATFLGAGAAYYTGCMKAGVVPSQACDVSHLRALGSTGSPLPPEAYAWGQQHIGPDMWWAVISGGTDIASAFLGGTPELPTVPGEMQARCLGADVQAWDDDGHAVTDAVGELVCVQPMPSMPLKFWGDQGHKRYLDSYFDTFPGRDGQPPTWRHGDWLRITPSGGAIIYGRSDATLNRHGHRLGTSELYRVVEALPEVLDSLVVDIEYLGKPSYMPLFVVLRDGQVLDDGLRQRLRQQIRDGVSPRFLPDDILQVVEIPRTLTGKKQELPVKKLLLGRALRDVVNPDACANPQAFTWFSDFAQRHAAVNT